MVYGLLRFVEAAAVGKAGRRLKPFEVEEGFWLILRKVNATGAKSGRYCFLQSGPSFGNGFRSSV